MGLRSRILCAVLLLIFCCSYASAAEAARPGRNQVEVRGQSLSVYFIPAASGSPSQCRILYAPGDGGWRGFGVTIGEQLAQTGCDVFGLDTRAYLQSFADSGLKPDDIAADYRALATWLRQNNSQKVLVAGWSEGAGLALAAAGSAHNRDVFQGVIAIGTTERNILAWRWSDTMAEIRKVLPNEPTFASYDYMSNVSPLPLFMIASSKDEYVDVNMTRKLFDKAGEPKQLAIIQASDHKYSGNTDEFYRTLGKAIGWISQNSK